MMNGCGGCPRGFTGCINCGRCTGTGDTSTIFISSGNTVIYRDDGTELGEAENFLASAEGLRASRMDRSVRWKRKRKNVIGRPRAKTRHVRMVGANNRLFA